MTASFSVQHERRLHNRVHTHSFTSDMHT